MKVQFGGVRKSNAGNDGDFNISYAPAKRVAFRWRWYVMLALVVSPIVYFFWFWTTDKILTEANGILTTEPIFLKASQSGVVQRVEVSPGQQVERGQRLVDLSSRITEEKLRVLNTNLTLLRSFQATVIGEIDTVLHDHRAKLETSMNGLDVAFDKYRELERQGLLRIQSDLQLERDRREVTDSLMRLKIDELRAQSIMFSDDLANTIRNIEIEITTTQVQQDELDIRASAEGFVNRVFSRAGEYVAVGDPLVEVSNYTTPVVHVYLKPERMNYAQLGQTATIVLPDGNSYKARIEDPVRLGEKIPAVLAGPFRTGSAAIKLVLRFDQPPAEWIEGLPVKVRFPLKSGSGTEDSS